MFNAQLDALRKDVMTEMNQSEETSVLKRKAVAPKESRDYAEIKHVAKDTGKNVLVLSFDLLVAVVFGLVHIIGTINKVMKSK